MAGEILHKEGIRKATLQGANLCCRQILQLFVNLEKHDTSSYFQYRGQSRRHMQFNPTMEWSPLQLLMM